MRTDKRIFHVFMCHGVEDYACVWYNIRRADIVPCAYRLFEAMRSISWRAVGDGTYQLYHAHIASPRRCDQFHGRAVGDGTWPLYHTPVMIQRIAADRWIWLRCIKVKDVTKASRIVVKVGTSTLTHANGLLNFRRIDELARVLSDLKNEGKKVVLVSSGAIGVGAAKLGMNGKPHEL